VALAGMVMVDCAPTIVMQVNIKRNANNLKPIFPFP
jgi:hypothetical protein